MIIIMALQMMGTEEMLLENYPSLTKEGLKATPVLRTQKKLI